MIHLTETGAHAGRTYCETPREHGGQYAHGAYAPLHLADFRAKCCAHCLTVWANEAYDETDEMPQWVRDTRTK